MQFEGKPKLEEKFTADPEYFDAKIAGWWVWGMCLWIGGGWCTDHGLTVSGRTALKKPQVKNKGILTQLRRPDLSWRRGVIKQAPNSKKSGIFGVKRTLPRADKSGIHKDIDIYDWIQSLSDRLNSVRVCHGDWKRVCSSKSVTTELGPTAIFLDPPYSQDTDRDMRLYSEESGTVAADVRKWCIPSGGNKKIKIALCGYDGEHDELIDHGWSVWQWKANGGYGNRAESENCKRERIWFSPSCHVPQPDLFGGMS